MSFAWKEEKLPDDSSSWLRIICSPQVFDKAAISHFASSNNMMLAANSANGAVFDPKEVPKPGPRNRQFCGGAGAYPDSIQY